MDIPKILILGPSWVGDMVLAQSLFKTLKSRYPASTIDVAAPAWTLPLLARMPEVDQGIALPFKHGQAALGERWAFGASLKSSGYTQAIMLTNSFKSALLPFAARIPRRTGFLGECRFGLLNDIRPLDKNKFPKTVEQFIALGLGIHEPLPTKPLEPSLLAYPDQAADVIKRLGYAMPTKPVLGLCPGAEYGDAKRWPAEYYAEVANAAIANGQHVWLFGSEKDIPVTQHINQLTAGKCLDFGGKTTLSEVIDLLSLTSTVISNDSGLMHVAAALDKTVVAIYGSSDPKHTPPMNAKAIIAYLGLSCSPCFKRICPLGHLNCLKNITPSSLMSKMPDFQKAAS